MQAEPEPATGFLVVRASGAAAAAAAMTGGGGFQESVQLLMRCPIRCAAPMTVPQTDPAAANPAAANPAAANPGSGGCSLVVQPVGDGQAVVMLTAAGLSIGFGELRPLMFQPVRAEPALRSLFTGAVVHVLAAGEALDRHGLAHHLRGLAELVLRSALRAELNRVDARQARRKEALAYIRANLADPDLDADRVAAALFISRRRLYQLFDDGQGVSERIRAMRLDRAKALLADPAKAEQGIAEISRACGFVSAAHFSRTFRKEVGSTPSEYRAR